MKMYVKATRYPNECEPYLLWTWLNNPRTYAFGDDSDNEGIDGKYIMYKSQYWDSKLHYNNHF